MKVAVGFNPRFSHAGSNHAGSNHAALNHAGSNHAALNHAASNHAALNHATSNHAIAMSVFRGLKPTATFKRRYAANRQDA
jgi:hypothetical protein